MSYRRALGSELDELKHDLAKLGSDTATLFQTLFDAGVGSTGHIREKIGRGTEGLLGDIRDGLDEVRSRGKDSLGALADQVSSRPLVSLLVVLGIGLAIGKLMERRNP
jgi:ElaB/YqjD/DUF883 family membrane-anchored ribosome-binding protein